MVGVHDLLVRGWRSRGLQLTHLLITGTPTPSAIRTSACSDLDDDP